MKDVAKIKNWTSLEAFKTDGKTSASNESTADLFTLGGERKGRASCVPRGWGAWRSALRGARRPWGQQGRLAGPAASTWWAPAAPLEPTCFQATRWPCRRGPHEDPADLVWLR